MSTPVSVTTPPRRQKHRVNHPPRPNNKHGSTDAPASTVDEDADDSVALQAHMQRMIDLQYQQQQFYNSATTTATTEFLVGTIASATNTMGDDVAVELLPSSSSPNNFPDANVGKGTLIWTTSSDQLHQYQQHHQNTNTSSSSSLWLDHSSPSHGNYENDETEAIVASVKIPTNDDEEEIKPRLSLRNKSQHQLASYGATQEAAAGASATASSSAQSAQKEQLPPPPPPLPQHDYHYGNPDYHDPFMAAAVTQQQQRQQLDHFPDASRQRQLEDLLRKQHQQRRRRNRYSKRWCCFLHLLRQCVQKLLAAESLHRSFCYGAIDGMLTGAGIVSTFCGMHLLSTTSNNSPQIRALVVAFTASTCFADSVCMAIGHIWTTRVLAATQATERSLARQSLLHSKAEAKGLLVDMLLAKGMLKIDAMSLADTLEGYPDLFVSALTGDSLSGGAMPMQSPPDEHRSSVRMQHEAELLAAEEELLLYESTHGRVSNTSRGQQQQQHSSPWWQRGFASSYGRLTDFEMDPDVYTVQSVEAESRKESLCMLLGFSLFAVVPSLIYTWVPAILFGSHDTGGVAVHSSAVMINPISLVIALTACVMWCLGVWKSRFLDSNWLLFGIETVLVLLICIACAYGLGALLNKLFLPDEYLLEVAKRVPSVETTVTTTSGSQHYARSSSYSSSHNYL